MNILVTGSAGFIGANLVKRLFNDMKSDTIVGVDNLNNQYDVSGKSSTSAMCRMRANKTLISN